MNSIASRFQARRSFPLLPLPASVAWQGLHGYLPRLAPLGIIWSTTSSVRRSHSFLIPALAAGRRMAVHPLIIMDPENWFYSTCRTPNRVMYLTFNVGQLRVDGIRAVQYRHCRFISSSSVIQIKRRACNPGMQPLRLCESCQVALDAR